MHRDVHFDGPSQPGFALLPTELQETLDRWQQRVLAILEQNQVEFLSRLERQQQQFLDALSRLGNK
jgi:hypothetical protein